MNREQIGELYDLIRVYFKFYVPRQMFEDSYYTEFKELPFQFMLDVMQKYCTNPENKQPPALTDVKNLLLREKWKLQGKLIDNKRHPTLTDSIVIRIMDTISKINKGLNGYGDEMESDEEFNSYLESIKPIQEPTSEDLKKVEDEINEILSICPF